MNRNQIGNLRAVANISDGTVVASVEIEVPLESVFQALTSEEIVNWWYASGQVQG